jgi:hypothetical protein
MRKEFVKRYWQQVRPKRGYMTALNRQRGYRISKVDVNMSDYCIFWKSDLCHFEPIFVLFPGLQKDFHRFTFDDTLFIFRGENPILDYLSFDLRLQYHRHNSFGQRELQRTGQADVLFDAIRKRAKPEYVSFFIKYFEECSFSQRMGLMPMIEILYDPLTMRMEYLECFSMNQTNGVDLLTPFLLDFLHHYDIDLPLGFLESFPKSADLSGYKQMFIDWPGLERELRATQNH